jgi:hypothetical protein
MRVGQMMLAGMLGIVGCSEADPEEPAESQTSQSVFTIFAARQVSYAPNGNGLPTNVQDAITAVNARALIPGPAGPQGPQGPAGTPGGALTSIDALEGLSCMGGNGLTHVRYANIEGPPTSLTIDCLTRQPLLESRGSVDFGTTYGSAVYQDIWVANRGGGSVTLGVPACTGDCTAFTVDSDACSAHTLGIDQSCNYVIRFQVSGCVTATYNAQFSLSTDQPSLGTTLVAVTGASACVM